VQLELVGVQQLLLPMLCILRGCHFFSAYKLVRDKRECIFPNPGFQDQLKSYQTKLEIPNENENNNNCIVS